MSQNILFIAKTDEAYRQLLLESEGFTVRRIDPSEARAVLSADQFPLAVITTERGPQSTLEFCRELKSFAPMMRVLVLAQRAEYLPPDTCIDALVREQYSPGQFVAAVRRAMNGDKPVAEE